MTHNEILGLLREVTGVTVSASTFQVCMHNLIDDGIVIRRGIGGHGNKVEYRLTGKLLPEETIDNQIEDLNPRDVDAFIYASISETMIAFTGALKEYSINCTIDKKKAEEKYDQRLKEGVMTSLSALRRAVEPPFNMTEREYKTLRDRYELDLASAPLIGYATMESDEDAKEEDWE